jgi:uncharacterized protein (DUF302 family)
VSAYERLAVDAPPAAVVSALGESLSSRAITEYAVVDHGRDMAAAGAPGHVAWTLVFGNPAAGAKLLEQDLAAAVDIPLRLAVIAAESGGSEIVLRDMRSLLADDLADLADALHRRAPRPGGGRPRSRYGSLTTGYSRFSNQWCA